MTTHEPGGRTQSAQAAQAATPAPERVRWLSTDEQRDWRAFRDGTARLLEILGHELEHDTGLSLSEYEILVRLSEAPERTLRMSELAGELAHSRSRLTHTIRRMETQGLVERAPCLEDARGVNCTMTEAGWQRIQSAAPSHVRSVRAHLVDVLTADQLHALGAAMAVVGAALQDGDAVPAAER